MTLLRFPEVSVANAGFCSLGDRKIKKSALRGRLVWYPTVKPTEC